MRQIGKPSCKIFVGLASVLASLWLAPGAYSEGKDLTELSLEALMNLDVTSVSRKEENASGAAAAVFVLTGEDIRRSGASSIPEALRLVPGLNVAQIDSSRWAITARGFNGLFANKLLVLIDGRSVYTPLFSGVNWDVQDTVLEDIERIEVIRGPGAALWGANAVNGVINIITKNSAQTQGGLAAVSVGNEDRTSEVLRYGSRLSESTTMRNFVKYSLHDKSERVGGGNNWDAWDTLRAGQRLDWKQHDQSLRLEFEGFGGNEESRIYVPQRIPPFRDGFERTGYIAGGHALTRWEQHLDSGSDLMAQIFYDKTDREDTVLRQVYDTVDIDSQYRTAVSERNELTVGANYRFVRDDLRARSIVSFDPLSRESSLISAFAQDEYQLIPQTLKLVAGTKIEHNDFTGFEFEPNIRAVWYPSARQAVWAAVSRATRTPSRADNDLRLTSMILPDPSSGTPFEVDLVGNRDLGSEDLLATEIGYRIQPSEHFSIDLATFYNHYENLRSREFGSTSFSGLPGSIPLRQLHNADTLRADTFGGELVADFFPLKGWHLQAWYSLVDIETSHKEGSPQAAETGEEGGTAQNEFFLRSILDLPRGFEFDTSIRYVDSVPVYGISSYTELSARLGWHMSPQIEFSLEARNALRASHREYIADSINVQEAEVERAYLGKVIWRF